MISNNKHLAPPLEELEAKQCKQAHALAGMMLCFCLKALNSPYGLGDTLTKEPRICDNVTPDLRGSDASEVRPSVVR